MSIEPGQTWKIDIFRPEDAEGVAGLFKLVYGNGYPIRTFIDAGLLRRENAAGGVLSSVARTPKGDIVGHNALFHSAHYQGTWESGSGVVHPDYRGGAGIFTKMVAHGEKILRDRSDGQAIFGEPVCNHVFSQKMCHSQGWTTHALEMDLMPAAAYAKEGSASGRVSALLDFKTLHTRPHEVFLPEVYDEGMRSLYAGLDDQRRLLPAKGEPPAGLSTAIEASIFEFAQVTRLGVREIGEDFAAALTENERRAQEKGVVVFQVRLILTRPWVGWAVAELRRRGYFFGGLLPRWFDDDGLLMQRMSHRPGWESAQIAFDRSRQIMALAKKDWESLMPICDQRRPWL